MKRSLPLLGCMAVMLALCAGCEGRSSRVIPATSVVIVVDVSKSFAPLTRTDIQALSLVRKSIVGMSREWEQPINYYWTTVATSAAMSPEPCGPPRQFRKSLLAQSKAGADFSTVKALDAWLGDCVARFEKGSVPLEDFSDVSGAFEHAAKVGAVATTEKAIIVLSDFREDLPSGPSKRSLALGGETIVMLYRPDPGTAPDDFDRRIESLSDQLMKGGAGRVCAEPTKGLSPGAIDSCFQSPAHEVR